MKYHHTFVVKAPLEKVAQFHSQSASMGAITLPPILVRVHKAPRTLAAGDDMDFTMWLGLPVLFAYRSWRTRRLLEEM